MRNIVLITLDSVRADHCSFMGYHRETTPTLDRMAKKGLVFENAIAPAPRTLPSMVQIFTGKYIMFTDIKKTKGLTELVNARRHLKKHETIPEMLKRMGYTTGAFCPNAYTSRYFGFDKGFDYFQDFMFTGKLYQKFFSKMVKEGSRVGSLLRNFRNFIFKQEVFKTWESYYDEIITWVEKAKKPFFLWIFLLDTHLPWIVPRRYRFDTNIFEMYYYNYKLTRLLEKKEYTGYSSKFIQKLKDLYDASIRYADEFVKNLARDLNVYDPVFIIHSDHGEEFGERGYFGHFYPHLYEENIHVPFIITNVDNTEWIKVPVSLLNLPKIIQDLSITGNLNSDSDIIKDSKLIIAKDFDYVRKRDVIAIRIKDWKYITGQKETDELYNLRTDPKEQKNLIDVHPELVNEMKEIIKIIRGKNVKRL